MKILTILDRRYPFNFSTLFYVRTFRHSDTFSILEVKGKVFIELTVVVAKLVEAKH